LFQTVAPQAKEFHLPHGLVSGTETVTGAISSFGSVIANGISFDDSGAKISMNDATATRDQLRLGMVVQVRGQISADR
jgi:hypothetical protein